MRLITILLITILNGLLISYIGQKYFAEYIVSSLTIIAISFIITVYLVDRIQQGKYYKYNKILENDKNEFEIKKSYILGKYEEIIFLLDELYYLFRTTKYKEDIENYEETVESFYEMKNMITEKISYDMKGKEYKNEFHSFEEFERYTINLIDKTKERQKELQPIIDEANEFKDKLNREITEYNEMNTFKGITKRLFTWNWNS